MSDRWRWSDRCIGQPCCGDCDQCEMEDDDEESSGAHGRGDRVDGGDKMAEGQARETEEAQELYRGI